MGVTGQKRSIASARPARRWVLATASLAAMTSGCSIGPDYAPPALSPGVAGASYRAAGLDTEGSRISVQAGPVAAWWQALGDDELTRLLTRLVDQNLSLEEARQRVLSARAIRGEVGADRLPRVDVTGDVARAGTGEDAINFRGPPPGEEADVYSAGFAVNWELDLWGRVGRLARAADADVQFAVEDYRDAAVSVAAELATAYIDLRVAAGRLDVLDRNVQLQRDTLRLAESELSAGTGSRLDVSQSKRQLSATLALRPPLLEATSRAETRIAVLLGYPPRDGVVGAGSVPAMPRVVGLGLPAELLQRRADIRRSVAAYRAAFERTGAAEAERYPAVTLAGTLNLQTSDVGDLFGGDGYTYNLGPSLRWPVFDGGRIDARVSERLARAAERRAAVERTILQAIGEVEDAAVSIVRAEERQRELTEATGAAREAVRHSETLYRAGSAGLLQVIDAQRELVALEDEALQARRDALVAVVQLYRALGGGWQAMDLPAPRAAAATSLADTPIASPRGDGKAQP